MRAGSAAAPLGTIRDPAWRALPRPAECSLCLQTALRALIAANGRSQPAIDTRQRLRALRHTAAPSAARWSAC
jgi:hypothetical protein